MAIRQITDENFDDVVAENDVVLLVFWASWSAHSQRYSFEYKKAAEKYPDIVFGTIDGEKYADLSKGFGVTTVPSTKLIREGITIFSYDGRMKAHEIEKVIEGALQVDMDDIRKQAAQQQRELPTDAGE